MGVSIRFTPLEGETAHHGGGVCVLLCVGATVIRYEFLRTNPTGREFSVPAGTYLAVKLLNHFGGVFISGCSRNGQASRKCQVRTYGLDEDSFAF